MKEVEESRTKINFFNKGAKKLIESSPPDILYELGIRAYTGSRDVPKDEDKALGLMQAALERAVSQGNQEDIDMAEYYLLLTERNMLLETMNKNGGIMHPDDQEILLRNDQMLEDKAKKGVGNALYTYAKELY